MGEIGSKRVVITYGKPMPSVFAKLNLKEQTQIVVLDSPDSFERELAALKGVEIVRDLKRAKRVSFSLAFVTTQEQVDSLALAIGGNSRRRCNCLGGIPKGQFEEIQVRDQQGPRLG